jgi:dTDP-4-amino-4,6-dideoxygalactose transaminase/predicted nucleic acid-binding protein
MEKSLKIFFDADVIIDAFISGDEFVDSLKLLNVLLDAPNVSLWVSAISVVDIETKAFKSVGNRKFQNMLDLFKREFSIIPFRRSTFKKAIVIKKQDSSGPAFKDAIQMASAEDMGMDFVVTRNKDHFVGSKIPALSPTEFLEKWDIGEMAKVNQVPFMDLRAQYNQIFNEIDDKIADVISRSAFILGNYVDEFERNFALAQDAKYCVGVSSGTDALHLALMALDIGPGDAVFLPVNTFFATAEAVALTGAFPVFVDIESETFNIDPDQLEKAIQESGVRSQLSGVRGRESGVRHVVPKAIIPVHLYGQSADMDQIMALARKYDLEVIEDCAQAHLSHWQNRKVGNFGTFGAFSFYPGKNLGAFGEAGAVTTNDSELFAKAQSISRHGETTRYFHQYFGHNYRMENFQGAVLSTKLKYLHQWTTQRQENAFLYSKLLSGIDEICVPTSRDGAGHVFHLYVIRARNRGALQKYLQRKGVSTGLHYPVPLHLQKACAHLGYKTGDFPTAEKAAEEILSLPMFPELNKAHIRYVCECIREFYQES